MFLVCNKKKLYSYIVALSTVAILLTFGVAILNQVNSNTIPTSSYSNRLLPIYQVDTEEKKVALTMNCAWNAEDIDLILQTLQKEKVKITFFMVGDWVKKYPEAVKKIAEAGHEIGNHSDTHPHVKELSYEKNKAQISSCSQKIKELTGKETKLYRGPYGEYNDTVIKAAKEEEQEVIQWNIDTLDYTGLTGKEMIERINQKLSKGSIILMHNGTKYTAESLEMILKSIKEKGYTIVPVSELIYQENAQIDANGVQKLKVEKEIR